MHHFGGLPSEEFVEQDVFWGAWQPFFAADDVRDAHEMIIHNAGEMIGREAILFHEDLVIDCVGGRVSREAASRAIRPGGTVVHVGLMDSNDGLDIRKFTLQEVAFIGTYTYTPLDLQVTLAQLHEGALGTLDWIDERPLAEGGAAFQELNAGTCGAPKVILRP